MLPFVIIRRGISYMSLVERMKITPQSSFMYVEQTTLQIDARRTISTLFLDHGLDSGQ
jgi:hypothetical protein